MIVEDFDVEGLPTEDIGLLTKPVERRLWLEAMRARYLFITELDATEREVAQCNPGHRWKVQQLTTAISVNKT